jgi:uncharacterized protein YjbI with pentapeptide repeats
MAKLDPRSPRSDPRSVSAPAAAPKPPRAPQLRGDLRASSTFELEDHASIQGTALSAWKGSHSSARGVAVEGSQLSRVALEHSRWGRPDFQDVRCEFSDFSAAEWDEPSFTRVELQDCRLTGARWGSARFEDARFEGCQMELWTVEGGSFKRTVFEKCVLREADFYKADLRGVRFLECDMSLVNLEDARLDGADVSTSNIEGARLGPKQLEGLIVNHEQAIALAKVVGMVVR